MGKLKEKLKFFETTNMKVGILLDTIRGFFIALILIILIVFFGSAIIHNILRIVEASNIYEGKYKNLYSAGDGMINLYSVGNGEKTVIILPSLGTSSPIFKYKAFADSLSTNYKVVIAEPLGYGYSLSTKDERTSENIIKELREALNEAKINGPYILLTFSNSSIYADYYSKNFPEEVNGIISIDGVYPESLKNENFKNEYLPNVISNVKFYSILSLSGLFRWRSYLYPEDFEIDKILSNDSYGEEEIKLYRNRIANVFLPKEMIKEISKLNDNMNELNDYQYNENLTTLQIITSDYRDEYLSREENISKYAKNLVTNNNIQKVRTIKGNINDYLYDKTNIRTLKSLISTYF